MTNSFKDLLSQALGPIVWNPNEKQLNLIAVDLARLSASESSADECRQIIKKHYPGALFYIAEGLDNSDINTILKMAIQAAVLKSGK